MFFSSVKKRFAPLFDQIVPPNRTLAFLFLLILVENGAALLSPLLAGQFSQSLLHGDSRLQFNYRQILLLWLLLIAIQSILKYCSQVISTQTSEGMVINLRTSLYDHFQALPISYFHEREHGKILSLLFYDASIISSFVTNTLVGAFPHLITALGAFLCIFIINPTIACLTAILIPFFIVVTRLMGRGIRPISKKLMQQYGTTFSIAEENLATLAIIKSFSREPGESSRFQTSNDELYNISSDYIKAQAKLSPIVRFLTSSIIIGILFIAGDKILGQNISTGELVSLMLYGLLLTRPISSLADAYGQTQRAKAAATRLIDAFSQEKEESLATQVLPPLKDKIILENVSFGYRDDKLLFSGLNLTIQAGETIAITGKNGAGKSSIAHLLIRLHSPQEGRILIDNIDIQKVSLDSLRSQIGLVQQNVLLRNSSVKDNILFGNPDATMAEIEEAAKASHALQFIQALPHKFDTWIGDQGIKLSGGQKQRLSLARALIKKPAILVLDEATAMFDPGGEEKFIKDNIKTFADLTVIIITHRPASLAIADRIYELKNGHLHLLP